MNYSYNILSQEIIRKTLKKRILGLFKFAPEDFKSKMPGEFFSSKYAPNLLFFAKFNLVLNHAQDKSDFLLRINLYIL